jgi:DnaK suppressor protein
MLNKTFLLKMKNLLLAQKQELARQVVKNLDIDTDGDETDEIQGNIIIDINNQLYSRNSMKLTQIEEALQRIADRSYGMCVDCEESIPEKRLLINPHFQICVSCAELRETEEKQRKRF